MSQISINLPPKDIRELDYYIKATNKFGSRSEVIRYAVHKFLVQEKLTSFT